jgi:hypothetical protein
MISKYILQGNCKKLLLSLLIAIIVMVPGVLALPQYLTALNTVYGPGLSCGTCHINPAGGGPRTAYGTLFESQTNHMTDPTAALTAIGSPTAAPTPTPIPTASPTPTPTATVSPTPTPTATPVPIVGTTASRSVDNTVLTAGNSTNVTVVISNVTQALSLKETLPPGWILTPISNDSGIFKASTNEWAWITTTNTVITVTYEVTVPSDAVTGIYNISGNITVSGTTVGVTGDNTINVGSVVTPPTSGTFGFAVAPLSATVNIGNVAVYNLTLTNNGNATDTYSLVADKPNNATVTLGKNSVTVGQGNVAVVGMMVASSTVGTYVVNVNATSANTNTSAMVTTTTNVIVPVLTIGNLMSVPNTAISNTNPAKISAVVTKGKYNITDVEFGIADSNNMLGTGADTILIAEDNNSGVEGTYSPEDWPATYMTIGNVAVTVSIDDVAEVANVRGIFKANNTSSGTEAVVSFNRTTGNMSNITDFVTGKQLTIQDANSTFQTRTSKFTNGSVVPGDMSADVLTLYNMTGNMSANNPSITVNTVPEGNYQVYAMATDANGNNASQLINIDTMPVIPGGSRSTSSSSGGTYPTLTATPVPTENVTAEPTTTTATETITPEQTVVETVATVVTPTETPVGTPQKKSPGIGIVAVIGVIGLIYAIRRRK